MKVILIKVYKLHSKNMFLMSPQYEKHLGDTVRDRKSTT